MGRLACYFGLHNYIINIDESRKNDLRSSH